MQLQPQPQKVQIKIISKNCTPFTDYISEINKTQIDHAKDIDVLIPTSNLIEYCDDDIYSKILKSLSLFYRDDLGFRC